MRTRALLSSGAVLLTVKSDDKISQASAVFQYLTTITLSPGERADFSTLYWGIPSHFPKNFNWHKARNHSGHVGMPLTCSYLYFNKPNRCTWICLSNSTDSTKNIKCFQSSHLIGIFKNIGIMPRIAWKCSPPVVFPQILMHLPWHRCIQKKTPQNRLNPEMSKSSILSQQDPWYPPDFKSLQHIIIFSKQNDILDTAKLDKLNLTNNTGAQVHTLFSLGEVYSGLCCTWRS